jgi:hypothetical protein
VNLDTSGKKVRGCGLRTEVFLQGKPNVLLEDFHLKLQKILGIATLDFETLQLCTNVANRLTVNLRFYEKFSDIWESFGIKDKSLNLACAQQIKKLTWLIYIVAKTKVLGPNRLVEDLTENIFLMYAVIIRMLNLLPEEVISEYLVKE